MKQLKISDYSEYPGGRFSTDGPWAGDQYRDEIYEPALEANELLEVDMTGLKILLPSFVDEAFGPSIKTLGKAEFVRRVSFVYSRENSQAQLFVEQTIERRLKSK